MKNEIERRFREARVEIRAEGDDAGATVVGYAVKWGELSVDLGGFKERWERGAFAESLSGDVVALFNHDRNLVLGRTPKTLRLEEDDVGLRYEIDLPENSTGENVRISVEREDIRGSSFAFRNVSDRIEQEDEDDMPIRVVSKAQLEDVSPVTRPAFPSTEVALRSIEEWREKQGPDPEVEAESRERKLAIAEAS